MKFNGGGGDVMTQRQCRFVENYFTSNSIKESAEKSGISAVTAFKFLKSDEVVGAIRERQRELTAKNFASLERLFSLSVEKLESILRDDKSTRLEMLQAIRIAIDFVFKAKEAQNLENGIIELERFNTLNNNN